MEKDSAKEVDFGFRKVAEEEKAKRVGEVFDRVAERYDLMNDLMSLGLHRYWKTFAVAVARPRRGERVLDVASGSGDLAAALARRVGAEGEVCAPDVDRKMLERGRDRLLDAAALQAMMERAGLSQVEVFNLAAGVVAVHRGIRFW